MSTPSPDLPMAQSEAPLTVHTSRFQWGELIFPRELIVEERHILTRKRHFPLWWIIKEEAIPYTKIGAIKITKGLIWSSIEIENTGGVDPIIFRGLNNAQAKQVREVVEHRAGRPE